VGDAKRLVIKPITAKDANVIVRAIHYSGKVDPRSQLHLGIFLDGKCGGAMQFGPSLQKSAMLGLVKGTLWNEFIELNRMAFADWLPRNSESRAIGYAFRWIKKTYPHIKWCVSFADGTQCGDGTIYRASGFALTAIKANSSMWKTASGEVIADVVTRMKGSTGVRQRIGFKVGEAWSSFAKRTGATKLPGFQLRYIYFIDPTARERLTVPILPFSEIDRRGAGMYKGKTRVRSIDSDATAIQAEQSGANPTRTL
jgi:hypothetical protein